MATEVYSKVENGEEGASDLSLLDALYLTVYVLGGKKRLSSILVSYLQHFISTFEENYPSVSFTWTS